MSFLKGIEEIEVVQKLGPYKVDKKGQLYIERFIGGKKVPQRLETLTDAINQTGHILKGYLGEREWIDGEVLELPGELHKMKELVKGLFEVIKNILDFSGEDFRQEVQIENELRRLSQVLGPVTNPYKLQASVLIKEEKKGISKTIALDEASLNLLKRIEEILNISKGIWYERKILLKERLRIKGILINVRREIGRMLKKIRKNRVTENDYGNFAKRFQLKVGLWPGLASIKIQPWLKKVRSAKIRRLLKLLGFCFKKEWEKYWTTLENVWHELETPVKEFERLSPQPPIQTLEKIPK